MADEPDLSQSPNHNLPDSGLLLAVSHSNGTAGSGQESDQFPNDYKAVLEYLLKREVGRVHREEERDRMEAERCRKEDERILKEEQRAEKLHKILAESLESSTRRTDKLQKAIVDAIKPPPSQDPKSKFWNLYKTVSGEHDDEFRDKYSGDLDTSLIFAGLFSAVSSAFIIQIQSNLQQNPNDVIQALLRLIVHNINGSIFSGPDLIIPIWIGPPPGIVAAEGMLYISLFATLLVALLAVLGKQWLAYYAKVGMRGTIRQRGIERQKKFDGFRKWGFQYVMMVLPILLQISLLLFGAAMTVFLWSLQRSIAGMVLAISLLGLVAYIFFVLSDIFATDSPFQTPLSAGLIKLWPLVKGSPVSVAKFANVVWLSCRDYLRRRKVKSQDPERISLEGRANYTANIVDGICRYRDLPLLKPRAMDNRDEYDCLAVLWMLETSTEPDVVAAAGSMAVDLQWSLNIKFIPPLIRLRDTFMGCFDGSPGLKLRESAIHQAITCGQAYHQLDLIRRSTQLEGDEADFPAEFFSRIIDSDSKGRPFKSIELTHVYSCLRKSSSPIDYGSFSSSFLRWALHILPYHFYVQPASFPQFPCYFFFSFHSSCHGVVDRSSFSNSLLCMGTALGFPLNRHDLAVINKSDYCEKILEEILKYAADCDQGDDFCSTVCHLSDTVRMALEKMDRPLDLSNIRYKEYIQKLCRALPKGRFRAEAAFAAIRLASIFQKNLPEVFNLTHASEPSSKEDEGWISEVSECVYQRLDDVDTDNEWDDPIVRNVEDHLRVLMQVPSFGRYKPTYHFLRILSNSMSPGGKEKECLRRLAISVIWLACDHWFDNENLRPEIQQLNILPRLGLVVDSDTTHHRSYMQLVTKLSGKDVWRPVIRYDIYRWIGMYQVGDGSQEGLKENCVLAFTNILTADELKGVEPGNISALAFVAMENVWKNFDFSAKVAMESFCPLAKCVWTLLYPNWTQIISINTAGELFFARLESAIELARNKVLEMRPQATQSGMGQEEAEVIDEIAKELKEVRDFLQLGIVSAPGSVLLEKRHKVWKRLDGLHESVLVLLTRPRSCLGIA